MLNRKLSYLSWLTRAALSATVSHATRTFLRYSPGEVIVCKLVGDYPAQQWCFKERKKITTLDFPAVNEVLEVMSSMGLFVEVSEDPVQYSPGDKDTWPYVSKPGHVVHTVHVAAAGRSSAVVIALDAAHYPEVMRQYPKVNMV